MSNVFVSNINIKNKTYLFIVLILFSPSSRVFVGPCHHGIARPQVRMEERPPIWRVSANKSNKQSRTADKWWSSSLRVGRGANICSP